MSDARAEILARIRTATSDRPLVSRAADYDGVARAYRRRGALDPAARLRLFEDRLTHYQVGVQRSTRESLARAIAQTLAARGRRRIVIPDDLPREWLPAGFDYLVDSGLTYAELDRSDGALTGCSLGIALTGTILLRHGAGEGRRAVTLIPDYHLCVVEAAQIVETVPEAFRLLAGPGSTLITTISGPSATSDIEMTRVRGVHGPRTLDVVILT